MNLDVLEARWRAGHILASDLSEVARELVDAGHDAPALRRLVSQSPPLGRVEARQTFERALKELGRGGMSRSDAALVLARHWAQLLLARKLSARRATAAIAHIRFRGSSEIDEALEPFCGLDDEYEAAAHKRLSRVRMLPLDRRARREAQHLLARE